jgi:hypothetical protein
MPCANGASTGTRAGIRRAIFACNHSAAYVRDVLIWAAKYSCCADSHRVAETGKGDLRYLSRFLRRSQVRGS